MARQAYPSVPLEFERRDEATMLEQARHFFETMRTRRSVRSFAPDPVPRELIEHAIAAIHTVGLATLTHTPAPMRFLSKILGRPSNERPFILFPVGYPAAGCRVPDITKKGLDQVTTWFTAA